MARAVPITALLFGIGSSTVKSLVDLMLGEVTKWVAAGAGSVLEALGGVLSSTTAPDLSRGFSLEYSVMLVIGAAVALPLLVLAAIQAIVRQDVGELVKAALVRLPVAVLLSAAAAELVSLALQASDALSAALLAAAGHPVEGFVGSLVADLATAATLTTGPSGGVALGGFAALLLAVMAAAVSFVLWLELVVRSAAVAASTLFLPLALAGLVWPATAHWARRLAETLAALVLAKVAIAGVLALAGLTFTSSGGASAAVEGIALILLASLAPFGLLRLVPMVEGGAVAHLDGLAHRAARGAAHATGYASGLAGRLAEGGYPGSGPSSSHLSGWGGPGGSGPRGDARGGGGGPGGGPPVVDDVPAMDGISLDTPEIRADAERIARSLAEHGEAS